LAMSDRIGFLSQGRLRQVGSPLDLIYSPNEEETAQFFGPLNRISPSVLCRPQDLEIRTPAIDDASALSGIIRKATIQTRGVLYRVEVANSTLLVFSPGPVLSCGTPVSLTLRTYYSFSDNPPKKEREVPQ